MIFCGFKLSRKNRKIIIINRVQLLEGGNNNTCAIIHFKRSHIENKFRQLDKFTFNLSIFFYEMFSLQSSFSNWIVNNNYNFKHLDIREQFIWLMSRALEARRFAHDTHIASYRQPGVYDSVWKWTLKWKHLVKKNT
jgi:hypothetical protein